MEKKQNQENCGDQMIMEKHLNLLTQIEISEEDKPIILGRLPPQTTPMKYTL